MKTGVYTKKPKNPRTTFLVFPLVVIPLHFHILHLIKLHVIFNLGRKNSTKMVHFSYFSHKFMYFLQSKCNNKFGMKPMLLSNGEQFNEGPH